MDNFFPHNDPRSWRENDPSREESGYDALSRRASLFPLTGAVDFSVHADPLSRVRRGVNSLVDVFERNEEPALFRAGYEEVDEGNFLHHEAMGELRNWALEIMGFENPHAFAIQATSGDQIEQYLKLQHTQTIDEQHAKPHFVIHKRLVREGDYGVDSAVMLAEARVGHRGRIGWVYPDPQPHTGHSTPAHYLLSNPVLITLKSDGENFQYFTRYSNDAVQEIIELGSQSFFRLPRNLLRHLKVEALREAERGHGFQGRRIGIDDLRIREREAFDLRSGFFRFEIHPLGLFLVQMSPKSDTGEIGISLQRAP